MGQEQNKYLKVGKKLVGGNEKGQSSDKRQLGSENDQSAYIPEKNCQKINLIKGFQVADKE